MKYEDACSKEGWCFSPFAMSTWGEIGPASKQLLFRIKKRIGEGRPADQRSELMGGLEQNLSFILIKQAAHCITETSNHILGT